MADRARIHALSAGRQAVAGRFSTRPPPPAAGDQRAQSRPNGGRRLGRCRVESLAHLRLPTALVRGESDDTRLDPLSRLARRRTGGSRSALHRTRRRDPCRPPRGWRNTPAMEETGRADGDDPETRFGRETSWLHRLRERDGPTPPTNAPCLVPEPPSARFRTRIPARVLASGLRVGHAAPTRAGAAVAPRPSGYS